mmetsp:Transcript_17106/g.47746  ORF Transcript_17106/g.47746 Transcript_17106/m.47746 type:complete len:277 (+) Transcript_17106:561-1391(+)
MQEERLPGRVVLHHCHPAEAGQLQLPGPARRVVDHMEGALGPHPGEAEQVLVTVDGAIPPHNVVGDSVEHQDVQRSSVPRAVDEDLPRLLLKHVHKLHTGELPDQAAVPDIENCVVGLPKVGPEDCPMLDELGGVKQVRRVPQHKVVRVQQQDGVEPGVVHSVDLHIEALLLPAAMAKLCAVHVYAAHFNTVQLFELLGDGVGGVELIRKVPNLHWELAPLFSEQPDGGVGRDHQAFGHTEHNTLCWWAAGGGRRVLLQAVRRPVLYRLLREHCKL